MPRIRTAHKFNERQRTGDVLTDELVDFKSLLLSPDVLKGLNSSGFERPSPIQLKAIPLGRCGLDLISQAKSGTGKTCVFSVIALESLLLESNTTQVLILAPTREIAVQIKDVISAIGSQMDNMVCQVFIGGLPVDDNKKMLKKPCHIAVGTPGRIKYLIENHFLKTESVRLFILDEADKLLEDNFQEQINWIFSSLPSNKQMMAFSATYPEYLAKHLTRYMREPTFVRLNATDPTLQGIKQFHRLVPFHPLPHKTFQEKVTELLKLLSSLSFHQCLVFSNYQIRSSRLSGKASGHESRGKLKVCGSRLTRAQSLCDTLRLKGWPSVFIAGSQTQSQRLKAMERLKQFKCRVLISTDLTSRGIDAENVNLVVNMDVPRDSETYLHRIGRAGRFGTQGVAVSFVARGEEDKLFKKIEESIGTTIDELPDPIPQSLGTAGNSTDLDSASVQTRTASVEVDILKCNSMRDSEGNVNLTSSHFHKNLISTSTKVTESGDADREIICVGDQRSDNGDPADTESIKNGVEILIPNQLPPQEVNMEGVAVLTSDAERDQEEISNIEERLQTSLCLHQQNCKDENICEKSVDHTGQKNNSVSQTQRNVAYFIAASIVCDASICHDGKEKESKTERRPPLQLGSSTKNSSEVNASLSTLQVDLEHFSQFDTQSCHKEETNVLNRASKQSDCIKPSSKEETVDGKLARPTEDERNSSGLQSEENNSIESNESDESSDSLEFDERETSDRASEQDHFLPSVEQFEEDFKEYLENVSYVVDNSIEELSQASELADDGGIYSEHKLHSDFKDDGYLHDETPTDAHVASQQFDTQPDTYHQMLHQDSYSTGYCTEQNVQGLHQTDLYYSAFHDNILPEGGWNSLHHCDQCDWFSNHNYYHDQGYNNYYSPFYGHHVANWWANAPRHPDSASSQQCPSQFYGDIGSYQDYQWNISWYNAYQRQTSCIRQFVSFSRSARM